MSERYVDDADWATAAEQSSEDDEAQEGNILAEEDRANTPAEHLAVHIVDDCSTDATVANTSNITFGSLGLPDTALGAIFGFGSLVIIYLAIGLIAD